MKKKHIIFPVICFFCFTIISCIKQSPQLPSNKGNVADESIATLLEINHNLALKEDSILNEFAKHDAKFKKNELGFWYKVDKSVDGVYLKDKEACRFACKMMLLNGKVLREDEKQVVLGKKQLVVGLEEALKLLRRGESATLIIPWYLGYGMNGNPPLVPPYTSLIYKIKLY